MFVEQPLALPKSAKNWGKGNTIFYYSFFSIFFLKLILIVGMYNLMMHFDALNASKTNISLRPIYFFS